MLGLRGIATNAIAAIPSTGAIAGTLSVTEANDTLSSAATILIQGTLSATEADDTVAATGSVLVKGILSATEGDDTVASTGTVLVNANAAITEGDDTLLASGTVGDNRTGTADITEADDTLVATAALAIAGTLSVTEADDTLEATATAAVVVLSQGGWPPVPLTAAFDNTVKVHWAPIELRAVPVFDLVFITPPRAPEKPVQAVPPAPLPRRVEPAIASPAKDEPPPTPFFVEWAAAGAIAIVDLRRVMVDNRPVAAAKRRKMAAYVAAAQDHDRKLIREWLKDRGVNL